MSLIAVVVGLVLLVLGKVGLDLASRQVQGWLFKLCFVVLRVARRRLPEELRVARHDEELMPELRWILFDKYATEPIVGLYQGFRFALGHVRGARRLARETTGRPAPRAWRDQVSEFAWLPARLVWVEVTILGMAAVGMVSTVLMIITTVALSLANLPVPDFFDAAFNVAFGMIVPGLLLGRAVGGKMRRQLRAQRRTKV